MVCPKKRLDIALFEELFGRRDLIFLKGGGSKKGNCLKRRDKYPLRPTQGFSSSFSCFASCFSLSHGLLRQYKLSIGLECHLLNPTADLNAIKKHLETS